MANRQVQEIKLRLITEGGEGLDKLKSSFRALEKSIGPTDKVIQEARQSIIDFVGSGKQSIQTIQGQIDAFKGLQTQATIGGNVYRQLAGDVNRLSDSLKALKTDYEEVGRAAKRTDAQIAAEFPARKPEAFRKQLAALNRQLDQLSVSAEAYGNKLTEITIKEVAFGRAQARQQVIAGAQAVGAPLIRAQQPQQQLPNTLAALQLRISELTQDFQNLDRGAGPYQETLAEINRLQRELANATEDGNADRKEEIRARIENYRQITAENAGLREQAAARRSIERGRARAAAGVPAIVQEPARRTSSLFEGIANIAAVSTRRETELLGKSYSDVAVTIQKVSAASDGSIASLQAQRGAWQALRNQIDPTIPDFKQASREIEQLDRRLGKLQQTQGRRMTGMQVAQAAGAAVSGGIFGGPEGFFGGALGGIFGGVGGAFAGAAAGAQVGMLRQQLGGFADYAAQLQKMQIALRGAAGSQEEFNRAVAAANFVVRNLNVPQDVAIQGMTQLTAAVKGAGGQVSDAELVFRNVTSAIKATGGSAQDVDGAITAMVQVFSKGKVSAEELSGQLGERLPGAVTKFAKANDMTLPELQKALEQGQVGLNELMNFIVQLGDEYADVAGKIAGSSQDAGARLTVAYNNMRISIGEALQPIGAQLQETFAKFVTDIAPAVAASAKAIADAFSFFLNNKILSGIAAFALKLGLVTAATIALRAAITSLAQINIVSWFTGVTSAARITGDVMAASAVKATGFATAMRGLFGILKSIAALGAITVAIDVVVRGFAQLMAARQALRELNARRDPVGATGPQPAMTAERRYTGAAREKVIEDINKQREYAARLRREIQDIESQLLVAESVPGAGRASLFISNLKAQADLKKAQLRDAQEVIKLDLKTFKTREQIQSEYLRGMNERFKTADGDEKESGKSAAEKAAREAEKARQEMLRQLKAAQDLNFAEKNRLDLLRQEEPFAKAFTEFAIRRAEIQRKYNDLLNASRSAEERAQLEQARSAAYKQSSLTLQKEINELTKKSAAPIVETIDKIKERIAYDREYSKLLKEGITPELAQQLLEIKKAYEESVKALEPAVKAAEAAILRAEAEGASATEIKKYREELEKIQKLPGEKKKEGEEEAKRSAEEKERDRLAKEKAERLQNLYSDIVGTLEDGIVGSLMAGIDALITGTKTLGEALKEIASGILKDIGQTLLRFAVNMGMRAAFPGAFAAKGAYFSGGQADFAQNSIKPFATGGIVTRPTFFKYANGGTMQNGLMGEAGPEAIMPLKRGADGKLGVTAKLDGAMGRYRRSPGSAGGPAGGGVETESGAATATMQPIDVRYSVERINQVDYVTADQFQAGMRQAAAQGAKQGEQRALNSLRQNTTTRRKVGI
jgi:tape measure domain-containing protein